MQWDEVPRGFNKGFAISVLPLTAKPPLPRPPHPLVANS